MHVLVSECLSVRCVPRVSVRFLHARWKGAAPAVKMGHPGEGRLGQGEQGAELCDLEAFPRAAARGGILSSSRGICATCSVPAFPAKPAEGVPNIHTGTLGCFFVWLLVALEMHQMGRSLFPMSLDLSRLKTHPKT